MPNEQEILLENRDAKEDSQRWITWGCFVTMCIYPIIVLIMIFTGIDNSKIELFVNLAGILYISFGGIVSVFFGAQAFVKKGLKK